MLFQKIGSPKVWSVHGWLVITKPVRHLSPLLSSGLRLSSGLSLVMTVWLPQLPVFLTHRAAKSPGKDGLLFLLHLSSRKNYSFSLSDWPVLHSGLLESRYTPVPKPGTGQGEWRYLWVESDQDLPLALGRDLSVSLSTRS